MKSPLNYSLIEIKSLIDRGMVPFTLVMSFNDLVNAIELYNKQCNTFTLPVKEERKPKKKPIFVLE